MKKLKASLADVTKKGGSIWVKDDGYITMHEPGWYSPKLHPLSAYRVAKTYFKNYQEFLSEIEYDKTPPALRVSGEDVTDAWFILFGGRGGYNDLMDLLASDLEEEKNYGYLTDEKEHAMWDKYDQDGLTQYLWDNLIGSSDEGAILQFIEDAVNDVSWEDLLTEAEAYMYTLVGDDIKGAEKVEDAMRQDKWDIDIDSLYQQFNKGVDACMNKAEVMKKKSKQNKEEQARKAELLYPKETKDQEISDFTRVKSTRYPLPEGKKGYSVDDVRRAGFTLEPMVCKHCGSTEVVYEQYVDRATCQECGKDQDEPVKRHKKVKADVGEPSGYETYNDGSLVKYDEKKMLEDFKTENKRTWSVFDYRDKGTASVEDLAKIMAKGSEGVWDYENEIRDMNIDYEWEVVQNSIKEFFEENNVDEEFVCDDTKDEMRYHIEGLADYDIKPLFNFNVLLMDDKYDCEIYNYAGDTDDPDFPNVTNAGNYKLWKATALKLVGKEGIKEAIINSGNGGNGFIGAIVSGDDIIDSLINKGKNVVGPAIVGISDTMNGAGHYVDSNETISIDLKTASLSYGEYSIGGVFGTNDWKY
jgi:ribosomal protein S27E